MLGHMSQRKKFKTLIISLFYSVWQQWLLVSLAVKHATDTAAKAFKVGLILRSRCRSTADIIKGLLVRRELERKDIQALKESKAFKKAVKRMEVVADLVDQGDSSKGVRRRHSSAFRESCSGNRD